MEEHHPKLTRGLRLTLSQVEDHHTQVPVIVRYTAPRLAMRRGTRMRGVREHYRFRLQPFVHMDATPEAIHKLADDPEVVRIYEDRPVRALLDVSVPHIQVPRLWDEGLTGKGVRIAVVDTGIDADHPDLKGRVVAEADFTGQGAGDRHGHGTHCAGIAAGSGAASNGKYRGVAPEASLYAVKVLRADGEGMMSDVMAGVEWAVLQGAQVISLSLGAPGPSDGNDALSELCDAAVDAGAVLCVAAGNEGPGAYTIGSPGSARKVITIGAINDANQVASFSSRGPTADGRLKPDVVLPGVNIVAARSRGTSMGTVVDAHYTSASGTSMATPHAAGVCALLLEGHPQLKPLEVKTRLMSTAVNLGIDPYAQGSGCVDAWRAYHNQLEPNPPSEPTPPGPVPAPGQGCLLMTLEWLLWGIRRK